LTNYNWYDKLQCISKMFMSDIKQIGYNKKYMVFGLPLLSSNLEDLKKHIESVEYKIYNIQFRHFKKINTYDCILYKNFDIDNTILEFNKIAPTVNEPKVEIVPKQNLEQQRPQQQQQQQRVQYTPKQIVFRIKPDIQNDIYHLYCLNNDLIESYYKVAYIPDYKTSVMMNKLFRNIKENENLDLLEESDDEEEFQNEREDRFVNLTASYNMLCGFNYKFKKWYPISLANDNVKVVQQSDLSKYDKK